MKHNPHVHSIVYTMFIAYKCSVLAIFFSLFLVYNSNYTFSLPRQSHLFLCMCLSIALFIHLTTAIVWEPAIFIHK